MREYTMNFKKQVVKKVLTDGISQIAVCRKLNLSASTVLIWKKKYGEEVKKEIEQINIDAFFVEEEVDIDKLLAQSEPESVNSERSIVEKIIEKRKTPIEYTISEKFAILMMIRKLSKDNVGHTMRRYGLHSDHLKLWEEEILIMGKKQINQGEYIKKLEEENKLLKKQLKNTERDKHELEIMIELKKKYKNLFKEEGEE